MNVSESDQKLVDEVLKEVALRDFVRKKEFQQALDIDDAEYELAHKDYSEYVETIAKLRPFSRTPLAMESFIAGWVWSRRQ